MIENNKFDQIYHEHLTYWSLTSLSTLLDLHNLEIFDVHYLDIHGGSIEVHACHRGKRAVSDSVHKMIIKEKQLGYLKFETYTDFARRILKIRDKLLEILIKFKKENKTVFALGAPIKGATLLNSFHINTDLIHCAVEINELKIGKYIPGVRIPIVRENSVESPAAFLLLAWNFLPELIEKYRDFLNSGGAFILPFPEPIIINKTNMHAHLISGALN